MLKEPGNRSVWEKLTPGVYRCGDYMALKLDGGKGWNLYYQKVSKHHGPSLRSCKLAHRRLTKAPK